MEQDEKIEMLGVARMAWTTSPPTEPGWYWYRDPSQLELGPEVLLVSHADGPDTPLDIEGIPLTEFTGEWQGPITPEK